MEETKKRNPWVMLIVTYLAAFSAPLNMFKVPAVAPALIATFGIDASGIGLLMSAYTLTGVVLALPAGAIARKIGYKQTSLIALGISIVGAAIGCFASDMNMLLLSRVFEGIGLCMMGVTGISIVVGYFPVEERGRAMGFFVTYMALAACLGPLILSAVGENYSFKMVWYVCLVFTVLMTLVFLVVLKNPEIPEDEKNLPRINMFKVIAENKQIWLLAIVFTIHNFVVVGIINNFASTYLVSTFGISMSQAGLLSAITAVCATISMIVVGSLSDKLKTRKKFIVFGVALGLIASIFIYSVNSLAGCIVFMIIAGIEGGFIPCMCQTAGPEILEKRQLAPVSQAFLSFGQNIGQFLGSAIFGIAAASIGWTISGWAILVPLFAIALVVALLMKIK